jgi:hypothetical protein
VFQTQNSTAQHSLGVKISNGIGEQQIAPFRSDRAADDAKKYTDADVHWLRIQVYTPVIQNVSLSIILCCRHICYCAVTIALRAGVLVRNCST